MGFAEEIAEGIRRGFTGDSWYVENKPYVLELRAPPTAMLITGIPVTYMVLPLGLQEYRVKRVFRQSITPTLGGLVAEEQGELWKEISISWDPGLEAKRSIELSQLPEPNPAVFGLSGPGWSRRMLYNYFENYAKLKSDPQFAKDTFLIWHDMKFDEHFVVVPSEATVDRVLAKRMRYPITMQFTSVGTPDTTLPPLVATDLLSKFQAAVGKVQGAISDINRGVAMVSAAIQEGSAILGEVRYFAATIDQVLTNLTLVVAAAEDFKAGLTATMAIDRTFVLSTALLLDEIMALLEPEDDVPDAVRQNLLLASDGLDAIAANRSAYGPTYGSVAERRAAADLGPGGRATEAEMDAAEARDPPQAIAEFGQNAVRTSERSLRDAGALPGSRPYTQYTSFVDYVVRSYDTIYSIAANKLNDGALWYDIAIINNLKPPYISPASMPNTVQPGDRIKIPVINSAVGGDRVDQGDSIYFTDFAWIETSSSLPGTPQVTMGIDRRTYGDAKIVTGIKNLVQALQVRHWTARGTVPLAPSYGLRRLLGNKLIEGAPEIIRLNFRENMLADPRVRVVKRVTVSAEGDRVEIDADIIPIGETEPQTIRAVVV